MTKISLKYEKRNLLGRKVKNLRKEGLIPANVFGKNIKSESISVKDKEFEEVFKKAGETQIIDLDGKPVLVSNIQKDPVTDLFLHVDFRQVDLKEKIEAKVPVEVIGESPAEKQNLGTVVQQLNEVEVEALPADLPEKLTVDASALTEVDQAIHVKDLKVDSKVTVKTDGELIVVKVEPLTKVEEPEPVVAPEGEVPAEGGEQPAEGGEQPASEEASKEEEKK